MISFNINQFQNFIITNCKLHYPEINILHAFNSMLCFTHRNIVYLYIFIQLKVYYYHKFLKPIHLILMYISKFCNIILFLIDPHKMPQTYQIMFDRIWRMEAINTKIYFHPLNNVVVPIFYIMLSSSITSSTTCFQRASCLVYVSIMLSNFRNALIDVRP